MIITVAYEFIKSSNLSDFILLCDAIKQENLLQLH